MSSIKRSRLYRWLSSLSLRSQILSGGATAKTSDIPSSRRRSGRMDVFPRLYASQLEPRIVLNGAPVVQLDSGGMLTVGSGAAGGDGIADTFQLTFSDSSVAETVASGETGAPLARIDVSVNHSETMSIAAEQVRSIQILGSSDVDLVDLNAELLDRFSVAFEGGGAGSGRDSLFLSSGADGQWLGLSVDVDATGGQLHLTRADGVLSAGLNFTGTIDVIDSLSVADRQISISGGTSVSFIGDGDRSGVESNQGSFLTSSQHRSDWQINATASEISVIGRTELAGLSIFAGSEGRIEVSGEVVASNLHDGLMGGSVQLRAGEVSLIESAIIDVSGSAGGGRIEVGGTLQGQSDGAANSQQTVIEFHSQLIADAIDRGDGGTVIIWSDEITAFAGTISARGADSVGDGGFVEVSGKERLWMRGQVDTSAANGRMGTLLLDPTSINIVESVDGSGSLDDQLSAADFIIDSGDPDAGLNTVSTGQLQAFVEGSNVILAATGDITLEDLASNSLTLTLGPGMGGTGPRGSLTLTSTTGAVIFAGANDVIDTGGGSLFINAETAINLSADVQTGGGDIVLLSSGTITTANLSGNAIRLQGTDVATGLVTASNTTASAYAVDIDATTLNVQGGILANTAAADGVVRIQGNLASDLSVDLTGGSNRSGDFVGVGGISATTAGGASLTIDTNGGNIHFEGDVSDLSGLSISNATTITLQSIEIDGNIQVVGDEIRLEGTSIRDRSATGAIALNGDLTLATNVTLSAEASIQISGRIDSAMPPATAASLDIQSELGAVSLSDELGSVSALASLNVLSTDLEIHAIGTSGNAGVLGDTQLAGSDSITLLSQTYHTGGSLTFTGPVSVFNGLGAATLWFTTNASDGDLRFEGNVNLPGAAVINVGGDTTFSAALVVNGNLQVSGNSLRFAGHTMVDGAVSVSVQNAILVEADIDATGSILLQANQDNSDSEGFVQTGGSVITSTIGSGDAIEIIVGGSGGAQIALLDAGAAGVLLTAGGAIVDDGDLSADVIADSLTLSGNPSVQLDTDIATLAANLGISGGLNILNEGVLTIEQVNIASGSAVISATALTVNEIRVSGDVTLIARSGGILDDNLDTTTVTANNLTLSFASTLVLDTDAATINLTTTGPGDITLDQSSRALEVSVLNIHSGDVMIDAEGDVAFRQSVTIGGSLDVAGDNLRFDQAINASGPITVTADNGLRLSDDLDAGDQRISLTANGDGIGSQALEQTGGTIRTTSTGTDALQILIGGQGNFISPNLSVPMGGIQLIVGGRVIGDGNPSVDTQADSLVVTAGAGIDLVVDVQTLSAVVTAAGDITISSIGDAEVLKLETTDGSIGMTSDGSATLTEVIAGMNGNINLRSNDGSIVSASGVVGPVVQGGVLTVSAATGIRLQTNVQGLAGGVSGTGDFEIIDDSELMVNSVAVADGVVRLTADSMNVGEISASGIVRLEATSGSITNIAVGSPIVVADQLIAIATSGIDLNSQVNVADLSVSGGGDLRIHETDGIDFTRVNVTDGNATLISGAGTTVMRDLTVMNGNLTIQSTGDVVFDSLASSGGVLEVAGDNITVQSVLNPFGAVVMTAQNRLQVNNGVDAGDHQVQLFANQDNSGSEGFVQSQFSASIRTNLATANAVNIQVGGDGDAQIWYVQAPNGGVFIDAGGMVADYGDAAADIFAQSLNVIAGTGVTIGTAVDTISATVSSGNIEVIENDSVRLEDVVVSEGDISITNLVGTMEVESVQSEAGNVRLMASDGVVVGIGSDAIHVRGINLLASATAGVDLRTAVDQVSGTVAGPGHFVIQQEANLRVDDLMISAGDAMLTVNNHLVLADVFVSNIVQLDVGGALTGGSATGPDLAADQLIARTGRGVQLETALNTIDITVTDQGDVSIRDRDSIRVDRLFSNQGNIAVTAATGEATIASEVIANRGAIELTATSGNLRFVNPIIGTEMLIQSSGPNASIRSVAGSNVLIDGPGVVLFQTPQSQYFNVAPDLRVDPIDLPGAGDIQVGFDGVAELEVSLGLPIGPAESFFVLIVDWGDQIETFTNANTSMGNLPLQRASAASGSELVFVLTHQYFSNPKSGDSTAPIPIAVTAINAGPGGSLAEISFFANGDQTNPLSSKAAAVLNVPSSGLTTVAIVLSSVEVPDDSIDFVPPPTPEIIRRSSTDTSQSTEPLRIQSEAPIVYERYYVLRIVVLIDETGATRELEDIRIDDAAIRNLPGLFEQLPDDRYRLYQVREDGVAQMITDVIIRGGKSSGNVEFDEDWTDPVEQTNDSAVDPDPGVINRSAPVSRELSSEDLGDWRSLRPGSVITRTGLVIRPSNEVDSPLLNHQGIVSERVAPSLSTVSDLDIQASLPMAWRWRMSQKTG